MWQNSKYLNFGFYYLKKNANQNKNLKIQWPAFWRRPISPVSCRSFKKSFIYSSISIFRCLSSFCLFLLRSSIIHRPRRTFSFLFFFKFSGTPSNNARRRSRSESSIEWWSISLQINFISWKQISCKITLFTILITIFLKKQFFFLGLGSSAQEFDTGMLLIQKSKNLMDCNFSAYFIRMMQLNFRRSTILVN